jgi:hypothetical protein
VTPEHFAKEVFDRSCGSALDTFAGMRASLDAPLLHFVTVYADVSPTERQRQAIPKDRVSERLYQLADPRRNKDADSRVKALAALYGLQQPVSFTLPTLEQIEVDIARRQVS